MARIPRRMRAVASITNPIHSSNVSSIQNVQAQIDRHWGCMPSQARAFILGKLSLDLTDFHRLAKFWSSPWAVEYTRGGVTGIVGTLCGTSWFIALNYLKLGDNTKASFLTLNGAFLHQCSQTPIDTILEVVGPNFDRPVDYSKFPSFSRGFDSLGSWLSMEAYIRGPLKYQHMVCFPEKAMDFVCQIGDDWRGTSAAGKRRSSPQSRGNQIEGEPQQITLFIQDGSNGDERLGFVVEPTANFKALFNDYAEQRGVSLRSLRFSYNGKTLFLSSVGNKSPNDLNIRDQDIIVVHDTSKEAETTSRSSKPSQKVKKKKSSPKRAKGKKKKQAPMRKEPVTLEEWKARHSKRLSKLHEEAEPRLKEIRTRLNSLGLERQPPKRRNSKEKKKPRSNSDPTGLPLPEGVGGKAGRSHFLVQVGEVQHLYRTAKPSAGRGPSSPCPASSTLDLHGHTREEALAKLDESLKVWVDTAMRGSYPFVISAKIVCGCGNQTIAETVEKWIKTTRNVGNAPSQMHQ